MKKNNKIGQSSAATSAMISEIESYVNENYNKMNNHLALVLPNRIVLRINAGFVNIWDNARNSNRAFYGDPMRAIDEIVGTLAEWYSSDMEKAVVEHRPFVGPDGETIGMSWVETSNFSGDVLVEQVRYERGLPIWTAEEFYASWDRCDNKQEKYDALHNYTKMMADEIIREGEAAVNVGGTIWTASQGDENKVIFECEGNSYEYEYFDEESLADVLYEFFEDDVFDIVY